MTLMPKPPYSSGTVYRSNSDSARMAIRPRCTVGDSSASSAMGAIRCSASRRVLSFSACCSALNAKSMRHSSLPLTGVLETVDRNGRDSVDCIGTPPLPGAVARDTARCLLLSRGYQFPLFVSTVGSGPPLMGGSCFCVWGIQILCMTGSSIQLSLADAEN